MNIDESRTLVVGDVIVIEDSRRHEAPAGMQELIWLEPSTEAAVQKVKSLDGSLTTITDIQLLAYRKTGKRKQI